MNQRTRKLMMMHKALHLRNDIDRLSMSRKIRGKQLISIENSKVVSIQKLKDYMKKIKERLIIVAKTAQMT